MNPLDEYLNKYLFVIENLQQSSLLANKNPQNSFFASIDGAPWFHWKILLESYQNEEHSELRIKIPHSHMKIIEISNLYLKHILVYFPQMFWNYIKMLSYLNFFQSGYYSCDTTRKIVGIFLNNFHQFYHILLDSCEYTLCTMEPLLIWIWSKVGIAKVIWNLFIIIWS